uniref:Secreted protein n=1 Tax=Cucumis sativus TaxID=3659 RepID=A0A0A0K3N3_CUCSA
MAVCFLNLLGSLLHVCIGLVSLVVKKTPFTLAAATSSKSSRTFKWVWDNGVISLGVLRKSRSSHIWRLCRVLEGLSLDYG